MHRAPGIGNLPIKQQPTAGPSFAGSAPIAAVETDRVAETDQVIALQEAVSALGTGHRLETTVCAGLLRYEALVLKWSTAYNLVGPAARATFHQNHLMDCVAACNLMHASIAALNNPQRVHIVDIGSGAGLPGLVGAILFPSYRFVLVEPIGKKASFLLTAVGELALNNTVVVHDRVQALQKHWRAEADDTVHFASRAFTTIADLASLCLPHSQPESMLFAMKSIGYANEIQKMQDSPISADWALVDVQEYAIPDSDRQRNLTILKRQVGT